MSTARVVVDTERIDGGALAEVEAACARADAELVPWRQVSDVAQRVPALLIGALRRGERRIPSELVDAVTWLAPDASLLLMSDEPLVRPVVSTHGGRVTLLSRPASAARIRGTVRMLLAEHGAFGRERLGAEVWTAVLAPGGDRPLPPSLYQDDDGAITALVPLVAGWSGAELLGEEAHALAQAHVDDDERLERLADLLGHAAGLVHIAAGCRQWTVYWPSTTSPILLCSPLRLPRVCDLAGSAIGQVLHLTATAGDLMVALAHPLPAAAGGCDRGLADGGPAFLDRLEGALTGHGTAEDMPAGIVVEVR